MYLRISSALSSFALLAACGAETPPPPGDTVDCAIGAGAEMAAVCKLERVAGGNEIILHHPDGGFRRVAIDPAAGVIAASDGVDPAVMDGDAIDGSVAFAIGADRYVVPLGLLTGRE